MLTPYEIRRNLISDYPTETFIFNKNKKKESPNDLPAAIVGIILYYCDFSEITRMNSLNKTWCKFVDKNKNLYWDKLLNELKIPSLNIKGSIDEIVKISKQRIKAMFDNHFEELFFMDTIQQSLQDELHNLLVDIQLENIFELQQVCKAFDIIIFWSVLKVNVSTNRADIQISEALKNINSIKELKDFAGGFKEWCEVNRAELTKIYKLNLAYKGMTSIPDEIELLKNLVYLNLDGNRLASLPPKLGKLKKLATLALKWNNLATVPNEICSLKKLKVLELSFNPLISLPTILQSTSVEIILDKAQKHLLDEENFWSDEIPDNHGERDENHFAFNIKNEIIRSLTKRFLNLTYGQCNMRFGRNSYYESIT